MNKQILGYLKIGGALVLSFVLAWIMGDVFFLGNTPTLRARPDQYIARQMQTRINSAMTAFNPTLKQKQEEGSRAVIASLDEFKTLVEKAKTVPLQQVSKGTYAQIVEGKTITTVNMGELTYKQYTYTVGGKVITIRVPENEAPPSQQEIEGLPH